jgi:hypothetical protein
MTPTETMMTAVFLCHASLLFDFSYGAFGDILLSWVCGGRNLQSYSIHLYFVWHGGNAPVSKSEGDRNASY